MATGASDISAAGPVCGRAMDSDKALVTVQAHTTSQPWVEAHGTQVCMVLEAAQPLDT